jgi:hypothetical protein
MKELENDGLVCQDVCIMVCFNVAKNLVGDVLGQSALSKMGAS